MHTWDDDEMKIVVVFEAQEWQVSRLLFKKKDDGLKSWTSLDASPTEF